MKYLFWIILAGILSLSVHAQELTQTVRGTVVDKESRQPLVGAAVILVGSNPLRGTVTDENGKFKLENIPLGRHDFKFSYIGYTDVLIPNVQVNAGKEIVLAIEMVETVIQGQEIVIKARSKDRANNEMAVVSARMFTMEDVQRYAGALGDPARMVANYAGVSGANDSRNDIIIRGNSPAGLLWRLEGIDIPSPNHFSVQGTTGGPVSILNNNLLSNSDFFTGAFPAEYGNATSGVFDLRMRNGNNEKYEFTGQVGFNGLEAMAEGPISRTAGSSFLISYRYSVLGFFQALGINLGPSGTPKYQDLSFKVNLPSKYGQFEVFGIGGISTIELLDSKKKADNFSYGQNGRDIYFGSNMGVAGVSHTLMFKSGYWKNIVSTSIETHSTIADSLGAVIDTTAIDTSYKPFPFYRDSYTVRRAGIHSFVNYKINANNTLKTGIIFNRISFDLSQRFWSNGYKQWVYFDNADGYSYLAQAYAQWKHDFTEKLSLLGGFHGQYLLLNNTWSLEPRAGIRYSLSQKQSFSFGYGLHGQAQPIFVYLQESHPRGTDIYFHTNENLKFTQAQHFVLGYDRLLGTDFRLKAETYYQYLYHVPVTELPSSFSLLNSGAEFDIPNVDSLVSKGTGRNYGIEFTLEKFFSKGYYFLFTASLFDSKYKGSDGIERNTAFNSQYTFNALGGKEWQLARRTQLYVSGKFTYAGGRRHTPIDTVLSRIRGTTMYKAGQVYSVRYPDYMKVDARLGIKLDSKRVTQEWAFDVTNATNRHNILTETYNPLSHKIDVEYQLAIFPMLLYRVQF
jgi:hypothetical protein